MMHGTTNIKYTDLYTMTHKRTKRIWKSSKTSYGLYIF